MKKYNRFEAECTETVYLDDGPTKSFVKGNIYESCNPDVWPDVTSTICLIDEQKEEHFWDGPSFRKHFKKLKHL